MTIILINVVKCLIPSMQLNQTLIYIFSLSQFLLNFALFINFSNYFSKINFLICLKNLMATHFKIINDLSF